ncbi:MAG: hypothetical protein ABDI19_04570 [Armatimonadota bacterium]
MVVGSGSPVSGFKEATQSGQLGYNHLAAVALTDSSLPARARNTGQAFLLYPASCKIPAAFGYTCPVKRRAWQRVLDAIEAGHSLQSACLLAGVNYERFLKRLESSPRLQAQVERAQVMLIDRALQVINAALDAGDVRTAMWVLERLRPEVWGKRAEQATQVVDFAPPEFIVLDAPERAVNAS